MTATYVVFSGTYSTRDQAATQARALRGTFPQRLRPRDRPLGATTAAMSAASSRIERSRSGPPYVSYRYFTTLRDSLDDGVTVDQDRHQALTRHALDDVAPVPLIGRR